MKLLRSLLPAFLQRTDLDLQQRHPRLWATRLHLHLWWLLLICAVVCGLGLLLKVTPASFPDPEDLFGYMMLPAVVYFACWVYQVVLFSPLKRGTPRRPINEIGEFILLWASIALIMLIPYSLALTVNQRIAHVVDDATFTADVDALNRQAWAFLEGDARSKAGPETMYGYYSGHHGHAYFRSLEEYGRPPSVEVDSERPLQSILDEWRSLYVSVMEDGPREDPALAATYLARIDSIETRFPLFFVGHGRFTPNSWRPWKGPYTASTRPFRSDSLLRAQYITDIQAAPLFHEARLQEALDLGRKYGSHDTVSATTVQREYREGNSSSSTIGRAERQLERIEESKCGDQDFLHPEVLLYAIPIATFVLTVLLSMFRSSYWQPFLIMLVTCALLPVVILILWLILEPGSDRHMLYTYYLIAIGVTVATPLLMQARTYRTRHAVITMLADLAVPFLPVFTLLVLHHEFDVFGLAQLQLGFDDLVANGPEWLALQERVQVVSDRVDMAVQVALWGGMALYVLVLLPMFRSAYVRLYALPEGR